MRRTDERSQRGSLRGPVAFEVDDTEPESGAGWSVLVRGSGHEVAMDRVPALLRLMHEAFPHPWAEGVHNVWVAIAARKVTGRRLTVPYISALL